MVKYRKYRQNMNKTLTGIIGVQNIFVFHKIYIIKYIKDMERKRGLVHI